MTSPRKIEDGQQPNVRVSLKFIHGSWLVRIALQNATEPNNNPSEYFLTPSSLDESVEFIRTILEKHGIK